MKQTGKNNLSLINLRQFLTMYECTGKKNNLSLFIDSCGVCMKQTGKNNVIHLIKRKQTGKNNLKIIFYELT
jgi:hypothetical protein